MAKRTDNMLNKIALMETYRRGIIWSKNVDRGYHQKSAFRIKTVAGQAERRIRGKSKYIRASRQNHGVEKVHLRVRVLL